MRTISRFPSQRLQFCFIISTFKESLFKKRGALVKPIAFNYDRCILKFNMCSLINKNMQVCIN